MSDLELREAVAREVMGEPTYYMANWTDHSAAWLNDVGQICGSYRSDVCKTREDAEAAISGHRLGTISTITPPAYESDIAAAWLVVEKMERDEWECDIECAKGMAFVAFRKERGKSWEYIDKEEGLTAPEAICRAALAAIRSQE